MKLETKIKHTEKKIITLRLKINECDKKLYELFKKVTTNDFQRWKKEKEGFLHEFLKNSLSNLYFLANLDQTEFARIEIDAEIDVIQEMINSHNTGNE